MWPRSRNGASTNGALESESPETHGPRSPATAPQAIVDVHEVTQRYRARVALDRFSISIREGTVVGILGPNGAGKTTLMNLVAGLSRPASGAIRWHGDDVVSPFPREVRRRIGMV